MLEFKLSYCLSLACSDMLVSLEIPDLKISKRLATRFMDLLAPLSTFVQYGLLETSNQITNKLQSSQCYQIYNKLCTLVETALENKKNNYKPLNQNGHRHATMNY